MIKLKFLVFCHKILRACPNNNTGKKSYPECVCECVRVAQPWQTLQRRGLCVCVSLGHGRLCNAVDCVCVCCSAMADSATPWTVCVCVCRLDMADSATLWTVCVCVCVCV